MQENENVPYGELEPLTDEEFEGMSDGTWTPEHLPEAEQRQKTHAYFERVLQERPAEWQYWFDFNAREWLKLMKRDNGRVTPFNPNGRRYKRRQLKLMAQQYGFDALGMNYSEQAKTADELLERAEAMAALGKTFEEFELL